MPAIVLDTSVVLPGALSPTGLRRKLLTVLAYGRLTAFAQSALDDEEAARREIGDLPGARIGGRSAEEAVASSRRRLARLAAQLPVGTPDDLVMLASAPLLHEYADKLREKGPKINRATSQALISVLIRQLVQTAEVVALKLDPAHVPLHTEGRDRDDDIVIHTAIEGSAEFVVSDDRAHLSIHPEGETEYCDPSTGRTVNAVTFEHFVRHHVDRAPFALRTVDGQQWHTAFQLDQ
jgi:predicted nucleic acid-binding protein